VISLSKLFSNFACFQLESPKKTAKYLLLFRPKFELILVGFSQNLIWNLLFLSYEDPVETLSFHLQQQFELDFESWKQNKSFEDENSMPTPEMIKSYGFEVEIHHVVTEDGYINTLHRIPSSSKNFNWMIELLIIKKVSHIMLGPVQKILTWVRSIFCCSGRVSYLWFGFGKFHLKIANFWFIPNRSQKVS